MAWNARLQSSHGGSAPNNLTDAVMVSHLIRGRIGRAMNKIKIPVPDVSLFSIPRTKRWLH